MQGSEMKSDHSEHLDNRNLKITFIRLVLTPNLNVIIAKLIVIALLQLPV